MTIPGPEPSEILETKACLDAKKIRFEINKFLLPNQMKSEFGVIRHPGAALAVPITDSGEVIILRQYRFACSRRILEFPAGTLEENESPLESIKREVQEETNILVFSPKAQAPNCIAPTPARSEGGSATRRSAGRLPRWPRARSARRWSTR